MFQIIQELARLNQSGYIVGLNAVQFYLKDGMIRRCFTITENESGSFVLSDDDGNGESQVFSSVRECVNEAKYLTSEVTV